MFQEGYCCIQGRELRVVALEDVVEGEVAEVAFISYVNSMDDTFTRLRQHRGIWYFTCQCPLCLDTEKDKLKHCVQCGHCKADRPVDTQAWEILGPCSGCKRRDDPDSNSQLQKYRHLTEVLTEEGKAEMSYDELAEWALGEMEDVFSERDILHLQTCHYVHTVCMNSCRWQAAVMRGEAVLPWFKMYYGPRAGIVAGLLLRLGQALGHMGDKERAAEMLEEANDIYRVVPGEKHPFYLEDFLPIYKKYSDE